MQEAESAKKQLTKQEELFARQCKIPQTKEDLVETPIFMTMNKQIEVDDTLNVHDIKSPLL